MIHSSPAGASAYKVPNPHHVAVSQEPQFAHEFKGNVGAFNPAWPIADSVALSLCANIQPI